VEESRAEDKKGKNRKRIKVITQVKIVYASNKSEKSQKSQKLCFVQDKQTPSLLSLYRLFVVLIMCFVLIPHGASFEEESKMSRGVGYHVKMVIVYWLPNMDWTISPPRMARTERRESLNCKANGQYEYNRQKAEAELTPWVPSLHPCNQIPESLATAPCSN
jgi:hypothetical protein